jgi:hypothetical protein
MAEAEAMAEERWVDRLVEGAFRVVAAAMAHNVLRHHQNARPRRGNAIVIAPPPPAVARNLDRKCLP